MTLQELLYIGNDDVIAPLPILKHPLTVIELAVAIYADRHTDLVLGKELNDLLREQRRVGSQAKLYLLTRFGSAAFCIGHRGPHDREIQQRLAAEESHMDVGTTGRLCQQHIH